MTAPTPTKLAELRAATNRIMVEKTPRKSFTPKQRQAVHEMQNGQCGGCEASLEGVWHIDHTIQIWMGGKHEIGNWMGLCVPCHKFKTARDAAERAHVKRLIEKDAETSSPSRLQGRGFQTAPKRPWPSRPFPRDNRKARKVTV